MFRRLSFFFFFFFNDTATTEIYTLSLHDALPISLKSASPSRMRRMRNGSGVWPAMADTAIGSVGEITAASANATGSGTAGINQWISSPMPSTVKTTSRSEEHTSELQSQSNLVCRLLLEKKKTVECSATKVHY